jgi:hypothetical protein
MSDDNNLYDRLQQKKDEYIEHYNREQERQEKASEALRTSRERSKPYTYTEVKYEKTSFAKILRLMGWIITIGALLSLLFFGDAVKNSGYTPIIGGTGIFLILLPSISRWIGPVLAVLLVIFLLLSENNGIEDYVMFVLGIIISLSIKHLLWKEKSRDTYTTR